MLDSWIWSTFKTSSDDMLGISISELIDSILLLFGGSNWTWKESMGGGKGMVSIKSLHEWFGWVTEFAINKICYLISVAR